MMKGKQIIIAGDEHQMPPSSFFTKILDGQIDSEDDLEDDENIFIDDKNNFEAQILNAVSLLDFASLLKFENISLDFHYRSKHPDLIEFSNAAFYNNKLIALPPSHQYNAIQYDNMDGAFIDRINKAEAIKVLEILQNDIHPNKDGSYPSVGIATFNIEQRNYIKKLILEKQQDPKLVKFSNKINKLLENGMFVKNLENIQGDERDIIIISTTYGKDKDGRQSERYGLLNFQKGYKLLNVIVTRAKNKCFVVTSIPEDKILNFRQYLALEKSNNRKAVFMAYLAYAKAVSENNEELKNNVLEALKENTLNKVGPSTFLYAETESPFEDEVYQYLAEYFGVDNLYTQYKFGGFRIDIVYDFKVAGIPKIAIECDGAKYHSSDEAYLHDIHRQKILEGYGFVFHRIWSTDWWRNPEFEFNRLKDFIETYKDEIEKKRLKLEELDFQEEEILFEDNSDEILFDPNEIELNIPSIEKNYIDDLIVEEDEVSITTIIDTTPKVKINSLVTVKYALDEKIVTLKIVALPKDAITKNDIIGIHYTTPIAQQLLEKQVGAVLNIPNTSNSVEILEIE
ncbi:hypothetical protein EAH69_11865 [Faecalibacter macacae]|uniref:DNA2/NAM7 helicase-like C-terminal domain-containing protein n=2 Tax=Faecalibacter macacae TaxID=1859289 RepID=A0A3L9M2K3_9FLAO|nr:hypothetical protein EAH69_11865 [Faecalibacter macacae]